VGDLRRAAADLVLGTCCVGCAEAGVLLCAVCAATMQPSPRLSWPDPVPTALREPYPVPPVAAGVYGGPLRHVIAEFKESGCHRLLPVLSGLLTASISALPLVDAPVLLVPMPSRRAAVRARGYDAVGLLARAAGRSLRDGGRDVRVAPLLRHSFVVRDQAGLDARARAANLSGALRARARPDPARALVVVDDVITTGSSMAEAVRALRAVGGHPGAIAVVAATPRRHRVVAGADDWCNPGRAYTVDNM